MGYFKITQQIPQMGKWEITVHIVSYFFQILLKTEGTVPKAKNPKFLGEQTTQIPKLWAQRTVTTKHFRNF